MMDVSGQARVDENEHGDVRGHMTNAVKSGGQAETVTREIESAAQDN